MNIPISEVFKNSNQKFSNIEELLSNIGANFEAEKREVYFKKVDDEYSNYPDYAVIVNKDAEQALSVVGGRYQLVQYKDALAFLNEMLNQDIELRYGFKVDNGAKIFVVLKGSESLNFGGLDAIDNFFTVSSSHDGSGALNIMATPIHRATQTIATPLSGGVIKIRHTVHVKQRMFEAAKVLMKIRSYFDENSNNFQNMATLNLTNDQYRGYFKQVFPGDSTRSENTRAKVEDIFKTNPTINNLPSCRGTLLGAYVSVLQYADYYSVLRESVKKSPTEIRVEASLIGSAAKLKAEAFQKTLDILKKMGF